MCIPCSTTGTLSANKDRKSNKSNNRPFRVGGTTRDGFEDGHVLEHMPHEVDEPHAVHGEDIKQFTHKMPP